MKFKIVIIFSYAFLFLMSLSTYAGNPNRTYYIKYILDNEGYAVPNERTVTVTPTKIYILRDGENQYWECEYKGTKVDEPVQGKQIIHHIYYLTNKDVYFVVSDYKLVKHNDLFYYRIVFAGQTQLAL